MVTKGQFEIYEIRDATAVFDLRSCYGKSWGRTESTPRR